MDFLLSFLILLSVEWAPGAGSPFLLPGHFNKL
nr:MAG TPA: hypothetical protein [Caudoviricetes sp.]